MSELFQDLFPNKEWRQIFSGTNLSGVKRKSSPDTGDFFFFFKEVYKLKMALKYVSMPPEPAVIKRDAQSVTLWSSPSMHHHQGGDRICFPCCV